MEAAFDAIHGVDSVVSGYMGGKVDQPSYEQVCSGNTGHAEVVQIQFDPVKISYQEVLEIFFTLHDPTTLNRQGNDIGTQYRSAIFWHTQGQKEDAEAAIAELTRAGLYDHPIVTEIVPATVFWPAEAQHQHYFANHPNQPYCLFVVSPKVAKVRTKFASRLKQTG